MLLRKESSHRFPLFSSSPPKSPPPSLARSFESRLADRLAALLPIPGEHDIEDSASLSFTWLASAVSVLSATLNDVAEFLANASSSDRDAIAALLDGSVALLDTCNAASAEVDRLLRRRLHLRFGLHLLSSSDGGSDAGKLDRALGSVADWRASPPRDIKPSAIDMARSLSLSVAPLPRGKISCARRAIFAVEAFSALIAGAVVAVLGGGSLCAPSVPADFVWAKKYKEVADGLSKKLFGDRFAAELVATESAVKSLTDVLSEISRWKSNGDGEKTDRLPETVGVTEELTEGLDELSNAVNELFHSALSLRNSALQGFRSGIPRCKGVHRGTSQNYINA